MTISAVVMRTRKRRRGGRTAKAAAILVFKDGREVDRAVVRTCRSGGVRLSNSHSHRHGQQDLDEPFCERKATTYLCSPSFSHFFFQVRAISCRVKRNVTHSFPSCPSLRRDFFGLMASTSNSSTSSTFSPYAVCPFPLTPSSASNSLFSTVTGSRLK